MERIVNMWNSLPDDAVNSSTIDQFRINQIDIGPNKEMMYDYKADLAEISSINRFTKRNCQ